jgi:protein-arginine kinase activator protein McsA
MAAEITLNNSEEFQEMVDRKDFAISKAVVESILSNVNGRKKHVHVLSVNCLEEEAVFDITLERRFFIDTLQENLKYYVEQELYEECETIVKAIDILKEKQNTPKPTRKKNGKSKTVSD